MKRIYLGIICCLFFAFDSIAKEKVFVTVPFNPVQGLVHQSEKEYRQEICLNGQWDFMPVYGVQASDFSLPNSFQWEQTQIKIPSPWNVNAFTDGKGGDFITYPGYPKKWEEAKIGWMKKMVYVPEDWDGSQLILHFEGVMGKALIYVNGNKVTENFELFLPFEADVTNYVKSGQTNEILVGVAKGELFDIHGKYGRRTYVGGSMWGIEMAGIWQDVYLFALPNVYVQDVFIQPYVDENLLKIEVDIVNNTDEKVIVNVEGEIRKWYNTAGNSIMEAPEQKGELSEAISLSFPAQKQISIDANAATKVTISVNVNNKLNHWSPQSPELYGAIVTLKEGDRPIDKKYDRFGWRQFSISGDRLLLNGEQVNLKGDSWHFTGVPQMTRRYAWAWYTMLKDANANAVRFHAQPFPRFYLDMADEMGICVLNETGIWSSDGGPKIDSEDYWESCAEHIRRLIKRDKNHASVFGWSVCNETVPVAMHVFKAPEELIQRQLQEINRWIDIVAQADPTRSWISGDGETDRPTNLPTIVGHYGGTDGMKHWASRGKPWGIGEQSMAYYGTPQQASAYNGDRAYESMLGRMEGIAIESYDLIKTQLDNNASYSCIFNLAWYALQPLPLGMGDMTSDPLPEDGIFFDYQEGGYGMQPERLGPYSTTLNPGYDNTLPLYRKWPLFDAVRCANAVPRLDNPVKRQTEENKTFAITPIRNVLLVAGEGSTLKNELEELGIQVLANSKITSSSLLIMDGVNPPRNDKQIAQIKKAMNVGARLFVMGISPDGVSLINKFLQFTVYLEERRATSFLVEKDAKELQGLTHANFYFSELIPHGKTAMNYGLAGDFLTKADVLLRACNTDWQRWNYQAETSKTGNVYRSEQEVKGSDVVMAFVKERNSEVIISTLDLKEIIQETKPIISKILTNLGVQLSGSGLSKMQALDENGRLNRALVWGPYHTHEKSINTMLTTDYISGETTLIPELNMVSGEESWKVLTGNADCVFEFSNARASGDRKSPVIYLSCWIYSPRSLSDLLIEPDMPSLDMYLQANGGVTFWINGKSVNSLEMNGENNEVRIPNIMLEKGWNHMKLKLVNNSSERENKVTVRFDSTDKKFMQQLLSSVVR